MNLESGGYRNESVGYQQRVLRIPVSSLEERVCKFKEEKEQ